MGNYARVVSLAMDREDSVIALVSPSNDWSYETGVLLDVYEVLEGQLPQGGLQPDGRLLTDVRATISCVPHLLYTDGGVPKRDELVVVWLVTFETTTSTLGGWPVVGEDGASFKSGELAGADPHDLKVRVSEGEVLMIAELMRAGRDYVEPTRTPLPPGIPTEIPNPIPPDS